MTTRLFTDKQVKRIFDMHRRQFSTRAIAEVFHCGKSTIGKVLRKESPYDKPYSPRTGKHKFTDAEVRSIRKAKADGATYRYLARKYNTSCDSIGKIIQRDRYEWIK